MFVVASMIGFMASSCICFCFYTEFLDCDDGNGDFDW